jgi:hypothetical protein
MRVLAEVLRRCCLQSPKKPIRAQIDVLQQAVDEIVDRLRELDSE